MQNNHITDEEQNGGNRYVVLQMDNENSMDGEIKCRESLNKNINKIK